MAEIPRYNKTRIAPTPSGYLHIGNVLSFFLTTILAGKAHARVLLRIDDMDRARAEERYIDDIFSTIHFLRIGTDEGPRDKNDFMREYSQLHRIGIYNDLLHELVKRGKVFACTCSRSQILAENAQGIYPGTCRHKKIPLDAENVSWRLDTSARLSLVMKGIYGETSEVALPRDMEYFVVRKKDGLPAYQLTSVADDVYFGIDLVVRGADLTSSTVAQLYLASLVGEKGFLDTAFYHHPLLMSMEGVKLSKSAGDTSIQYLRSVGYSAGDIHSLVAEKIRMLQQGGQLDPVFEI